MSEDKTKTTYELCYLASPELKKEEVLDLEENIEKMITEPGGRIENKTSSREQMLAYLINHKRNTIFAVVNFHSDTENIEKFSSILRLDNRIVRFMFAKKEKAAAVKKNVKPKKLAESKVVIPAEKLSKEKSYKKKIEIEELDRRLEEILEDDIR